MHLYFGVAILIISGWLFVPLMVYSFFIVLFLFKEPKGIKLIIPLLSSTIVAAGIALLLIISPWKLLELLHIKYVGSKLPVFGFIIGIMSSSLIMKKTKNWIKSLKMQQNSKLN